MSVEALLEKEFWRERLTKEIPPSNIRLDFNRPNIYSNEEVTYNMEFKPEIIDMLNRLTGNDDFLLYTVLMSVLNICLYRYSGAKSFVVGSPVLKTKGIPAKNIALPVYNKLEGSWTFRQFLLNVRSNLLEVYENQNYPLDNLVKELVLEKDLGEKLNKFKSPIFDLLLQLDDFHDYDHSLMNDITLSFRKNNEYIRGRVSYNTSLFRKDTIEQFALCFIYILETALKNTDSVIDNLVEFRADEKRKLFDEWNRTETDYPSDLCAHQIFEAQAEKNPQAIALRQGDNKLTYRDLNQQANQLAHYLRARNIGPDVPVGLFVNRSPAMIIGLLGVLKAGGAYVPIDPTYPKERLVSMLESVELPVILTSGCLLEKLDRASQRKSQIICIDKEWPQIAEEKTENLKEVVGVDDTAYVIFTSGTTGIPKAAAVRHQGWTNLLNWFSEEYKISSTDRVLIISSFSFDITQRSIAMPLINGGELDLLTVEYYDPDLITQTITKNEITILNCSPSTFYPLIEDKGEEDYKALRTLKCLFLGGEAISPSRLKNWAVSPWCNAVIGNVYGAAECSDVSSFYNLRDFDRYIRSSVPIGRPIYNSKVYILDENLKPVPPGVVGEICLAGVGVGKGYINDEEMTKEKFLPDPFCDNKDARLYRTGDLGRYLPDGCLEFAGRVDYQVKIRGLRIELGDIESVLRQSPLVNEVVVVDKVLKEGDQRLVAYIKPAVDELAHSDVPNSEAGLVAEARRFAQEKLPAYMLPNFFIPLDQMPLSPNGKIDRNALRQREIKDQRAFTNRESAPENMLEKKLVEIFSKMLSVERIGVNDNIFHLGAHSLLVTRIVAAVNVKFGLNLTPLDVYKQPTVSGLAERIRKNTEENPEDVAR